MPAEFIFYVTKYGYWAIFLFVFLQEIGIPNPIPNELILFSSGYLIFTGVLKFSLVLLSAVFADFIGTLILYVIFYFSGTYLIQRKPRWLPFPERAFQNLKERISRGGLPVICIGRFTPFFRGYTTIIAGLLQIKSITYLPIAFITTSIWTLLFVVSGILLGPLWKNVSIHVGNLLHIWILISIIVIAVFVLTSVLKIVASRKN